MLPRTLGWAIVLGTAVLATILLWPQAFGLQNQWIAAHVVAMRGAAAVLAAVAFFLPVRFSWIPMDGEFGLLVEVLSVIGVGVVLGLMAFGFFGLQVARVVGVVAALLAAPFSIGFLHDYPTLSGSLVAYAVSAVICAAMSIRSGASFDFALIRERVGNFEVRGEQETGIRSLIADAGVRDRGTEK
jgi:hypothetical protein